ncbi:enoyl-CoA hydratase/isomerase family protein [Aestuariispira insulae]|uniref:Enoyl-CoA hydratase/carnithine racemase n=1 Tax=Aestuariispira insulae TaxID=1461337 RepID=A0A3D9HGY9_9PROT|nr:enoyl-CoA hydratase/isomerase family protein [Aestuariispira insulae]RED48655.1 enoyl-CoA hydratase/carnithine racemase [Aestuariispira insulae]
MYSDFETLAVRKSDGVAWITFDNGELNLLDMSLVGEMVRLADLLEADDEVRVMVFQSANPDYFLSHAHFPLLQDFRDQGAYDSEEMPLYSGLLEKFRRMPKASIAKIEGRARGGGAEFAMAMDMCFAAEGKGMLSQMEIIIGILPGGGAAAYLARKLGRARAMEICLGGGDFEAALAAEYGYINRALPADELDGFVEELATRIASYAPEAIARNKAAVNLMEDDRQADFIANNRLFRDLVKGQDFDRRVELFLAQGGETRAGELADWKNWAERLR